MAANRASKLAVQIVSANFHGAAYIYARPTQKERAKTLRASALTVGRGGPRPTDGRRGFWRRSAAVPRRSPQTAACNDERATLGDAAKYDDARADDNNLGGNDNVRRCLHVSICRSPCRQGPQGSAEAVCFP